MSSKVSITEIPPEIASQFESLRSRKGLKPIGGEMEGTSVGKLPASVFGFTYSPPNEVTPLFAQRTMQSFEVHKCADGSCQVLGFLKKEDAAHLNAGEGIDCQLYPQPNGDSTSLVEVDFSRILRFRPASRSDGNFLALNVGAKQ